MVTYFGPIFRYKDTTAFGDILNKKRNDRHEIHGWVEVNFNGRNHLSCSNKYLPLGLGLGGPGQH